MIYDDELTERDWYIYRRGEMAEYIRNHKPISSDIRHELFRWVASGYSVQENPWGIYDPARHLPCDYITAMNIKNTR